MSAYFEKILREQHRQLKEELKTKGIESPRRSRAELDRINKELKKELSK